MAAPSILIIDDEPDLLVLFSASLRKLPYRILNALNGDIALSILREETPILIILDVAMPYPDGLELLRMIRADARFETTHIMLLTAVPSRVGPDELGMVDKIASKPITPRGLEQIVIEIIGQQV